MSRYTVADYVLDRLEAWQVKRVFGYSGDAINPVITSFDRPGCKLQFVQGRHEEMCAFMACAHAKFTGEIGVCMSTSGPGAIHLLNGLYDAKMDNQPVLAIVGQQARKALGTSFMQDVDLSTLFKDVAADLVHVASSPDQIRNLMDRAMITALSKRKVACLILPHDLQIEKAEPEPEKTHGQSFTGIAFPSTALTPPMDEISRAAEILNAGEKVAILVGAGALHAREEVEQVAELLNAGVAKALLGKAVVPDDKVYVTGSIGVLGTEASTELMKHCDTLFMIGTNFPYAEFLPTPGTAKGVQIDLDAANLSLRYPMDVALIGDAKATLAQIIPILQQKQIKEWPGQIAQWQDTAQKHQKTRTEVQSPVVNPEKFFAVLSDNLPEDAIITCDSGTSTVWFARYLKMKAKMMASVSGSLASMGCSVPYALAAKFAYPDRPVVICSGDGAMQMAGNAELLTLSKYCPSWSDQRMVIVVLKNNDLNFVTWEMRETEGKPRTVAAQELPEFDYVGYARSLGFEGIAVNNAADIEPAIIKAFAATKPVLLQVLADPDICPTAAEEVVKKASTLIPALMKEGNMAALSKVVGTAMHSSDG